MKSRHLMLVPSLACPASCTYCFGPHKGEAFMSRETIESIVQWQNALGEKDALEITFHGGEPLVPGASFYRMALPLLRERLLHRKLRFSIQSNLWLLTDDLCKIFREYNVSIGTSLDGPQHINDVQRVICAARTAMRWRIGHCTDEVVVSVDGDRKTLDERRGAGSYDMTQHNLRSLVEMGYDTDLSPATVLPLSLANGAPGDSVRALARELGSNAPAFDLFCRLCDRGFTSKKNYHILISRFLLVPMIFARKNTDIKRILATLTPPLDVWNGKPYLLGIWKKIVKEFAET